MGSEFDLKTLADATPRPGPVLLIIMDGVGVGRGDAGDAVALANTPVMDRLAAEHPSVQLRAHGTAVGMPSDGDMGNSEVGHNALGCGRVFDQGAKLVDHAIESGAIFRGEAWTRLVERGRAGGALHLIGLLSDGNVHSHIDQIIALIREADRAGVGTLFVHPLLDGRDVGETTAHEYLETLEGVLAEVRAKSDRNYRIASGGGRMVVTMDRYEADWRIVERGWRAHVLGDARRFPDAMTALRTFRAEKPGITDQFLPAFVVEEDGEPVGPIRDGDGVVCVNFRGDRAIELSRAFMQDDFPHFGRERRPDVFYAGMMEYDGDLHIPANFLVEPPAIDNTIGQYLSASGIAQLAVAETQKFGHVTYFWNGNCSGLYDPAAGRYVEVDAVEVQTESWAGVARRSEFETQIEIPSDLVPFEERPWMKAGEVTDAVLEGLRSGRYGFVRVNYANGDMVGHTGDLPATMAAVSAVDLSIGRLLRAVEEVDGLALITADHGNADEMIMIDKKSGDLVRSADGRYKAKTSHTLNPVPCWLYDPRGALRLIGDLPAAGLANVAATLLGMMGFEAPEGYEPTMLA